MIYRVLLILSLSVISQMIVAQNVGQKGDTLLNYTDINGMKQGIWRKVYPNGKLAYEGKFRNNKPIGEFKRYFEDGDLKAILVYEKDEESAKATLYHKNQIVAAEGSYFGKEKHGVWNYYSIKKQLILSESYKKGLKHGKFVKYHNNGKIAEESNWIENKQDGMWRLYFDSGRKKLETKYINGKRSGLYYVYYENGQLMVKGEYLDDKRNGNWTFYKKNGDVKIVIDYLNGKASNSDELDKLIKKEFDEFEKNRKRLKDPAHYRNNIEEYIRSTQ